jgi:hypothetical protein
MATNNDAPAVDAAVPKASAPVLPPSIQRTLPFINAQGSMKLDVVDLKKKFMKLMHDASLEQELAAAVTYVVENVSDTPLGKKCPVRSPKSISDDMASPDAVILASGSLNQLNLSQSAVRTYDAGRIAFYFKTSDNLGSMMKSIGNIAINYSIKSGRFHRMNKDAEVHVLCLLAYWLKSDEVNNACADLAFEFQWGGVGSKAKTGTLKLIDEDDKKRKVQGLCGWRRCLFYGDLLAGLTSENRFEGHNPLHMRNNSLISLND